MFAEENFSYPPSRKVWSVPYIQSRSLSFIRKVIKPCSRGLAKRSENPKAPPSVRSKILVAKCNTVGPNYTVTP